MNAFAFKVIDAINRDGMDNGSWGLVKDVDNTVAYFGTREEIELKGQWAYIYAEKDDTLSLQLEKIEPTRVLHVEDCELLLYYLDEKSRSGGYKQTSGPKRGGTCRRW